MTGLDTRLEVVSRAYPQAYKLRNFDGLPENTYIFHSHPSSVILTSQGIAGRELQHLCIDASGEFLRVAHPYCLEGKRVGDICEIVFMSGGNFYGMKTAFERTFQGSLPQAYIGIGRYVPQGESDFVAPVSYKNFEAVPKNLNAIIGDTIATGTTMRSGIMELFEFVKSRRNDGYSFDSLAVFTLCGAIQGGRELAAVEKEIQQEFPDFRLYFFAAEALFGLQQNGTDMPFYHPETLIVPEMKDVLKQHPGVANLMKCAVFDWGNRCKNPEGAYKEFIDYCNGIDMLFQKRFSLARATGDNCATKVFGSHDYDRLKEQLGAEQDWEVHVVVEQLRGLKDYEMGLAVEELRKMKVKARADLAKMNEVL